MDKGKDMLRLEIDTADETGAVERIRLMLGDVDLVKKMFIRSLRLNVDAADRPILTLEVYKLNVVAKLLPSEVTLVGVPLV